MAFNSSGFSPVSSASHTTLPVPQPRMPDQPTNLTAVPVANNRIVVSWQDNSGGQDTFNIFRSTDGSTFTQVATAAKGAITFTDSLATSTTYFYQITATNSKGNTPATPVVSATLAPPAPTSLTATAASSVQVNLAWTADSSNVTSFAILQSTDGVNFTQRTTVIPSTRSFSITYLSP